jgi:hypothetical protein
MLKEGSKPKHQTLIYMTLPREEMSSWIANVRLRSCFIYVLSLWINIAGLGHHPHVGMAEAQGFRPLAGNPIHDELAVEPRKRWDAACLNMWSDGHDLMYIVAGNGPAETTLMRQGHEREPKVENNHTVKRLTADL